MHITWDEEAWNDYVWWQFEDRKTLKRINAVSYTHLRAHET